MSGPDRPATARHVIATVLLFVALPALSQHADEAVAATLFYTLPETSGDAQSPVNILTSAAEFADHEIFVHYQPSGEHIVNLGHTIEADFEAGSTLEYDGLQYNLQQLHFHTPAEHLIDGITYPMEMHMVHTLQERPEQFLVIGVLFREGLDNAFIGEVLAHVPAEEGGRYDAAMQINPADALGTLGAYYHYEGSLTTPPYSETVTWLVMKEIHTAAPAQIEALNRLEGNNARHIQHLHERRIEQE